MLLLARQRYKMNDSLEKMYPLLKSIKRACFWYMERLMQEDLLMRTYTEILKEVAEALYLDWTILTLGIAAVREVDFKDLSVSQQDPFIDCAKIIIKIVGEDTGRLLPETEMGILNINLEDLVSEKPIGEEISLTVCYDCLPTLREWLKNGIKKAEEIALSDAVWKY